VLDIDASAENSMRILNSTNARDVYVIYDNQGTGTGDDCTLNLKTVHGAGDPKIRLQVASYEHWDIMVDNSDNDAFKIIQQNDVRLKLAGGRGESDFTIRAWINFNGSGTVAIRDSHNVSSLTDAATGDYLVYFSTAMPSANFSSAVNTGMGVAVNSVTGRLPYSGHAAGNFRIGVRATNNQAWIDEDFVSGIFVGG
jgi:hypothetical protein